MNKLKLLAIGIVSLIKDFMNHILPNLIKPLFDHSPEHRNKTKLPIVWLILLTSFILINAYVVSYAIELPKDTPIADTITSTDVLDDYEKFDEIYNTEKMSYYSIRATNHNGVFYGDNVPSYIDELVSKINNSSSLEEIVNYYKDVLSFDVNNVPARKEFANNLHEYGIELTTFELYIKAVEQFNKSIFQYTELIKYSNNNTPDSDILYRIAQNWEMISLIDVSAVYIDKAAEQDYIFTCQCESLTYYLLASETLEENVDSLYGDNINLMIGTMFYRIGRERISETIWLEKALEYYNYALRDDLSENDHSRCINEIEQIESILE